MSLESDPSHGTLIIHNCVDIRHVFILINNPVVDKVGRLSSISLISISVKNSQVHRCANSQAESVMHYSE